MVERWKLGGVPRGVAVSSDQTIYVGLAEPQSVVAIDPREGVIRKQVVLDREEIASTKDFTTLRIGGNGKRLYIAQGSDESVSILSLPELAPVREIGLEGELIRDAVPDPAGRYLYVLGRGVHVFDIEGERELKLLREVEPMAIAVTASGSMLAVVGAEVHPNARVTTVVFYDPSTLLEIGRKSLQTEREIRSALFAADDRALAVLADDWLAETSVTIAKDDQQNSPEGGKLKIDLANLVSSESICLPQNSGAQIAASGDPSRIVVFAERRCSAGGSFTAARRNVTGASLYGISAWAVSPTPDGHFAVTDPQGYLTIYRQPSSRNH